MLECKATTRHAIHVKPLGIVIINESVPEAEQTHSADICSAVK